MFFVGFLGLTLWLPGWESRADTMADTMIERGAGPFIPVTAECLDSAASAFGNTREDLLSLMKVESGGGRHGAARGARIGECIRHAGQGGIVSMDCGPLQINEGSWPRLARLLNKTVEEVHRLVRDDGCFNVAAASFILSEKRRAAHGDARKALGLYHSATPALRDGYLNKVDQARAGLDFPGDGQTPLQ